MLPLILAVVGGYFIGDSMKNKVVFAEGGVMDEGVDLFEDYKNIPPDVQEILDRHQDAFMDGDYIGLGEALDDLENIGYTFEFYVDGGAYDLRQIGQRGKSEQESAEYYGGNYEEGGEISRSNQEMVSSQVKAIKHHADELSNIITDKTPIEAWVVAKVERSETDLSDVTHYLDGLKYGYGGMMDDDEDGEDYDIVIVYKDNEDGGKKYRERYFDLNAPSFRKAKSKAIRLWEEKYEDSDLEIIEILSHDDYRNKYIKFTDMTTKQGY